MFVPSGRRDLNPQQPVWKTGTLPIELRPHVLNPYESDFAFKSVFSRETQASELRQTQFDSDVTLCSLLPDCTPSGIRTLDPLIKSQLL